jgi:phosphatidylserine/phosphatidylglycerophosphate/cardiolipin synthase-like enzyme
LHAKVYCADGRLATVTSGNLTGGGLFRNYEYGVLVRDPVLAARIQSDVMDYAALGAELDRESLLRFCEVAVEVRDACKAEIDSASRSARARLSAALREAGDQLVRAHLAGGALHTVLGRTILFLLRRDGPLSTVELHPRIQQIHPDLCDDSVDRVIDGKSFGKKWKHAVRTAQQTLSKRKEIVLVDGRWILRA